MFVAILYPDGVLDHMIKLTGVQEIPKSHFDISRTENCELWCHYFVNDGKAERFCKFLDHDLGWVQPAEVPEVLKLAVAVAS